MEKNELKTKFPTPSQIQSDIQEAGFKIYKGAVDAKHIEEMKTFWEERYAKLKHPKSKSIRGNLRLGEVNFDSYSDDREWKLYRNFDFLWNKPVHDLTREVTVAIHKLRNHAQGLDTQYGLTYSPDCYGVYISTSRYPVGGGYLRPHVDGHEKLPILQYMLPLTFRGESFKKGGLFILSQSGEKIDVEKIVEPGDLIFFDGRMKHGVDPIEGDSNQIGRLATFAIPTFFKNQESLPQTMRSVQRVYYAIESRIRMRFDKSYQTAEVPY